MPHEAYTIRAARAADAAAAAELWSMMARQHRAYDAEVWCWAADAAERWREKYVEFAAAEDMITPVAETRDGRLIGYAVGRAKDSAPMFATKRSGELWDLLVLPAHRNRGLATRLMEQVFYQLRGRGAEDMTLHAALANTPAIRLYEKLGFQCVMYRMYKRLAEAPPGEQASLDGCIIRPAGREDADAAAAMWAALVEQARAYPGRIWAEPGEIVTRWRQRFRNQVEHEDRIALVAADDAGRTIGFVEAKVTDSEALFETNRIGEVWNLFVRPEDRGRGIGRRLLEEAFRHQRARGCDDVVIHVDLPNAPATAFYRKVGMRPVMYRMYKRL